MLYVGIMSDATNKQKIKSFKDLNAWKEGHELVVEIYRITKYFPKEEQFGLTNQIRRAAVSITSNLAEGFGRQTAKEKHQFYSIARGSLSEVENQLQIAFDVGFLPVGDYTYCNSQVEKVGRLITGLRKSVQPTTYNPQPSTNRGYITLISILVIGAIGTAVTVSMILSGLSASQTTFAVERGDHASGLVNACAEEALQQIRDNSSFTGFGGLLLGQGTCGYTVTSGGGENRTIQASSTVGTIVKKVSISIDAINPQINVTSWQEVADF